MLAGLDHEHIVPVYDVGCTPDGFCFVVSKLIDGESLASRACGIDADYVGIARLVAAVADALDHAHRHGLVHRDIKPANLLIDRAGKPYLADFGLALKDEDFGRDDRIGRHAGLHEPGAGPGRGAPGRRPLGHLQPGRRPVRAARPARQPFAAARRPRSCDRSRSRSRVPPRADRRRDPARAGADLPPKAMATRASERYETARDFADELRRYAEGAGLRTGDRRSRPRAMPRSGTAAGAGPSMPVPDRRTARGVRVIPKGLRSFGADDADFFLDLLPGPRDRDGLPESLRFWKARIEAIGFVPVGLIYGPSGCGKSSMVKAGLLPRLAPHVIAIHDRRRPAGTEAPGPGPQGLPGAPARGDAGRGPGGSPAGHGAPARGEVADRAGPVRAVAARGRKAPRRSWSWPSGSATASGSRRSSSSATTSGWRRAGSCVSSKSGSSRGRTPPPSTCSDRARAQSPGGLRRGLWALPDSPSAMSPEQHSFVEQAVAMIEEDGAVMPVRLALLAEMVKGRPWTTGPSATSAGPSASASGSSTRPSTRRHATPEHRLHAEAASRVLAALLPGPGADIKGHVRSHRELLESAGYATTPAGSMR